MCDCCVLIKVYTLGSELQIAKTRIIHDAFVIAAIRYLLRLARRQLTTATRTARINCHDSSTVHNHPGSLATEAFYLSLYPSQPLVIQIIIICTRGYLLQHQLPQIHLLTNLHASIAM